MSRKIAMSRPAQQGQSAIKILTEKELKKFSKELNIVPTPSKYAFAYYQPEYICLFDKIGNDLFLPFAYGKNFPRPERENFPVCSVSFSGVLREEQKQVKKESMQILNKNGSVVLSCYCGFGKSCLSLAIAVQIKLPTLIVCHRIVLIKQWKQTIERFCPDAKIKIITGQDQNILSGTADFYIVNALNISKHPREYYKNIGLVIVDEVHVIMAKKLSKCMQYLVPRYLIGLSATPYRTDGLDVLMDMYFGTEKIIRELWREHTVYKVSTDFKPEVELNKMGKIDWGKVLDSQCKNVGRNEKIIKIVQSFSNRNFLILCKRILQAEYLYNRLKDEKEDVTSLIGKNQEYEQSSRILIGTAGKIGVGFDHPKLDTLILASDVEQYFVQYLGRVFRRPDSEPVIFDIVDNFGLLQKHFRTRNSVYTKHGGTVIDFSKEFPNFFI